jgi:hypothetical protein
MIPHGHTCVVCGRAISALDHYAFHGTCDGWRCRTPLFRRLREEQRLAEQRHAGRQVGRRRLVEALRDQCLQTQGHGSTALCPALTVPANCRALVPLSAARRERFGQHLRTVIETAFPGTQEPTPPPQPFESEPATVLAQACATCAGRCCQGGGDEAYLTPATIRRFRQAHPEATATDVHNAYWSRLVPRAYEDSCPYHSGEGCALPRELRSETCNGFCCEDLVAVETACAEGYALLFIAAVEGEEILRWRLVPGPTRTDSTAPAGAPSVKSAGSASVTSGKLARTLGLHARI